MDRKAGEHLTLDELIKVAGRAPVAERHPVLAVGSNASPGQLVHKFDRDRDVAGLVPMTRARVRGLGVGHSAHVSKAGYVPYAPHANTDLVDRELIVLWLDAEQLVDLHETEPNYHWIAVSGQDYPAVLASGGGLGTYSLYQSRWGVLRRATDGPIVRGTTQAEIFDTLARQSWFDRLVPECRTDGSAAGVTALGHDPVRRDNVREAMKREGFVAGDGIRGSDVSRVSLRPQPPR